jgi:hypothetical protein
VHLAPQLLSIWYIPVYSHLSTPQYFSDNTFCLSYLVLAASDRIIEAMEVNRITARAIARATVLRSSCNFHQDFYFKGFLFIHLGEVA